MHILHLSSAKTWRGGEQQLAYLLVELRAKGVQQTVFCVLNSALHDFCQTNQFTCIPYRKKSSINPFVGLKIQQICQQESISHIHIHDAHAHTFAYLSAVLWGNKTPWILSRRVDFPVKDNWLSRKKYNHPSIKKIICVSEAILQITAPSIQDKTKLGVVHSGIDLERFNYQNTGILRKEFNILSDTILIGNISAIAPHKDYFTFVDTAALLVEQQVNAHFLIIGKDDGEGQAIQNYIQEKGLNKHITLTGFRSDIPQILPELDIFVMTSKTEGLGTSILDAFACRVPVVACRAGGIPESVIHEQTGLLAAVGDSIGLAKQVQQVLRNPDLVQQLTDKAYQHLQMNFTKERMAERTLEAYNDSNQILV